MPLPAIARELATPGRVARFLAVGASGAALDTALLAALHEHGGVPLLPAKLVAAEAAIVLMFLVNDHWTFADDGDVHPRVRRLATSNAVRLGGLATGTVVLLGLRGVGVWYVAANAVGLGAGFVVNYCCESLFTWRVAA